VRRFIEAEHEVGDNGRGVMRSMEEDQRDRSCPQYREPLGDRRKAPRTGGSKGLLERCSRFRLHWRIHRPSGCLQPVGGRVRCASLRRPSAMLVRASCENGSAPQEPVRDRRLKNGLGLGRDVGHLRGTLCLTRSAMPATLGANRRGDILSPLALESPKSCHRIGRVRDWGRSPRLDRSSGSSIFIWQVEAVSCRLTAG
jgi:hypothetical protein